MDKQKREEVERLAFSLYRLNSRPKATKNTFRQDYRVVQESYLSEARYVLRHFVRKSAKAVLLALVLAWSAPALAGEHTDLLAAMRQVESGGNDHAIGDSGRSHGPLQCQRATWDECCRFGGVKWNWATDAWDYNKSCQVARWYWSKYNATTDEARCRLWNGGPGWRHKMKFTDAYWARIQRAMKARKAAGNTGFPSAVAVDSMIAHRASPGASASSNSAPYGTLAAGRHVGGGN